MSFFLKKNNAKTTINQVGGLNATALTVIVTNASNLPVSGDFLCTSWDKETYPNPSDDVNAEIIKVTGVSGNILTIERGQEDTIGHIHTNGSAFEMLITAGTFTEIEGALHTQNTDTILTGSGTYLLQQLLIDASFYLYPSQPQVAQIFLTSSAGNITKFRLAFAKSIGSPPQKDLTLEVRDLDINGLPDNLLHTQVISLDDISTIDAIFTEIILDSSIAVDSNTEYAVILKLDALETGYFSWSNNEYVYTDGYVVTYNGADWTIHDESNTSFEVTIEATNLDLINDGVLKSNLAVDAGFTIDGRDVSVDGTKLDTIEESAVALATVKADTDIEDAINKTHDQNTDTSLDVGGDNEVSAEEIVDHIVDTENPHEVVSSQVLNTLFGQDLNGDLQPMEDYFGQGGSFELDSNYDLIPTTTIKEDLFFEYDINNDLIPKE